MSFALLSGLISLCVIVITGCLLYLHSLSKHEHAATDEIPTHLLQDTDMLIIGERFRILESDRLIQELKLHTALNNIRANLGLSDENWAKDALPFLHNYIAFVQRLPASESHHHAGDGGLVKHTLDVAALALMASTSQSWPPNAKTEDIAKKTAAWRYGIMCAAILHDVGKTLTNFHIQLYHNANEQEGILWLPDAGNMLETGRQFYRVSFPENKAAYATHAEIAWTFFQAIVPSHVRQWLTETDSQLMLALRHYLSGEKDKNPLHSVITQADMASVSRDLKSGNRQRFASASRIPLIEIIMETLREMLSQRGSYFSIATQAGGDLFRQGDTVYMMAKNVPDYIRQYLRSTNNKAAPSFPNDNQRIFDTLLEYGAVEPDPFDANRAVQHIRVVFVRTDGVEKDNVFSVLKFKLTTLFPNGEYPHEFQGKLTAIGDMAKNNQTSQYEQKTETAPAAQHIEAEHITETVSPQTVAVADIVPADIETVESLATTLPEPSIVPPIVETVAADSNHTTEPAIRLPEKNNKVEPTKKTTFAIQLPQSNKKKVQKTPPTPNLGNTTTYEVPQQKQASEASSNKNDSQANPYNIDTLLNKYQMLELEAEPNDTDNPTKATEYPEPAEQVELPSIQAESPSENLPENNNKKRNKNALLAELFAAPSKAKQPPTETPYQEKPPIADSLPIEERAQTALNEIEQQRDKLPTSTPRPVAVHKAPDLAQIQLAVQLNEFQTEHTAENQPNPDLQENDDMNALDSIKKELREHGAQFLNWLANGLADGSIEVNNSRAPVHFIDKGMLLVTPAIFKEYAGGVFNKAEPLSLGVMAQRGFVQLKLHERTRQSAIFYAITTKGDAKKLFHCYLIPEQNIKHIIQPASRPQNNTDIALHIESENLLQMKGS